MQIARACILSLALGLVLALAPAPSFATAGPPAAPASPLPWIHDDYPRALALARERKVPIFVENWAPW